jgi:hypothetical protein
VLKTGLAYVRANFNFISQLTTKLEKIAFFVRNNKTNKRLSKDKINKINSLESKCSKTKIPLVSVRMKGSKLCERFHVY